MFILIYVAFETATREYRIKRGVRIIRGLEMTRYNNDQRARIIGGGCLEKKKKVISLGKHVYLLYIHLSSE